MFLCATLRLSGHGVPRGGTSEGRASVTKHAGLRNGEQEYWRRHRINLGLIRFFPASIVVRDESRERHPSSLYV